MSDLPWRTEVNDHSVPVPDTIWDALGLEEGDVVTASILLDSGDVPSSEELNRENDVQGVGE